MYFEKGNVIIDLIPVEVTKGAACKLKRVGGGVFLSLLPSWNSSPRQRNPFVASSILAMRKIFQTCSWWVNRVAQELCTQALWCWMTSWVSVHVHSVVKCMCTDEGKQANRMKEGWGLGECCTHYFILPVLDMCVHSPLLLFTVVLWPFAKPVHWNTTEVEAVVTFQNPGCIPPTPHLFFFLLLFQARHYSISYGSSKAVTWISTVIYPYNGFVDENGSLSEIHRWKCHSVQGGLVIIGPRPPWARKLGWPIDSWSL